MSLEERVTDLEIRLTYQQKVIATLDEVVREFAARVEQLEKQVASLGRGTADEPAPPTHERPPHY